MEKFENSCSILARLNLDDVEMVVRGAYHRARANDNSEENEVARVSFEKPSV